jgi:LysM repeat protein
VQVTDAAGHQSSATLSSVIAATLKITTASLLGGTAGVAYSATLAATGGSAPYTWTVTSGTLPPGLILSTSGVLWGSPTTSGAYTFGIQVQDSIGALGSQSYNVSVSHSVMLNWSASTSSNLSGYNVYRASTSGGPYTIMTPSPVAATTYTDNNVLAGQTYYYVAVAVDINNNESLYSNEAQAIVPTP